jgi:hypothetical protein
VGYREESVPNGPACPEVNETVSGTGLAGEKGLANRINRSLASLMRQSGLLAGRAWFHVGSTPWESVECEPVEIVIWEDFFVAALALVVATIIWSKTKPSESL